MTTRRTKRGASPAPLAHRELAAIKAHAAHPRNCYDNSAYVARMRQLERHVLLLVAEVDRMGLVRQLMFGEEAA